MSDINMAVDYVLKYEDPYLSGVITTDDGGRTRWGIAEHSNPGAWAAGPPSLAQARSLYIQEYASPGGLERIEDQNTLNYALDIAVNMGVGGLKSILGRVFISLPPNFDDYITAINHSEPVALLEDLMKERCLHYGKIVEEDPERYARYLVGWLRRTFRTLPNINYRA